MAKITWTNLSGGAWNTVGNWSSGTVPATTDDVVISQAGAYTITINTPSFANSLLLNDAGANLTVNQTLNVPGTISLNAGTLTMNGSGWIDNATLVLNGGAIQGNDGTLDNTTIDGTLNLNLAGERLDFTGGVQFNDITGTLPGIVNITGNGAIFVVEGVNTIDNAAINIGSAGGDQISMFDTGPHNSQLTLGANSTVTQAGASATFTVAPVSGNVISNLGSITLAQSGGNFTVSGAAFSNSGWISAAGETVAINATQFTNSGTIFATGGVLTLGGVGAAWTNSGTISVTNATLNLSGATDFASINAIAVSGGTTNLSAKVNGAGGTLAVGAGTNLGPVTLQQSATIQGGTILDSNSGMSFNDGTLDSVAYRGTIDLSSNNSRVEFKNSSTLTDYAGVNPGFIKDTGSSAMIYIDGSGTLDNATVQIGNAGNTSYINDWDNGPGNFVATLGPSLQIVHKATYAQLTAGYGTGDVMVNQGSITGAVSGGVIWASGKSWVNQGSVTMSGGDSFVENAAAFSNSGTISSASATVTIGGTWTNTGTISTNVGLINLGGSGNVAGLGTVTNTGGTVAFTGQFDMQGQTLDIGQGTALGLTALGAGAVMRGGTLHDAGGAGMLMQSGTFDAMTYEGTMDLSQVVAKLNFIHTLTLTNAAGTGPGTVNLSGNSGALYALAGGTLGDATLDAATINLGSNINNVYLWSWDQFGGGNARLQLASGLTVNHGGYWANMISGSNAGDQIINNGTINAKLATGNFNVSGYGFANAGAIAVANGDAVFLAATHFTNSGTMNAAAGGLLQIGGTWSNTGQISETNATLTLGGTSSFGGIGNIQRTGGTVNLNGYLEGNGGTLTFGAGSTLGILAQQGQSVIHNATLVDQGGSGGMIFQNGMFDTVTYRGTIDLSTSVGKLNFINSLTVTDTTGTLPGTIIITGNNSALYGYNMSTLDNATVSIGSGFNNALDSWDANGGNSVMTLGSKLLVTQVGQLATLMSGSAAGDGVVNQGTITNSYAGGTFSISGHSFTNDTIGTVSAINGGNITVWTAVFSNLGAMTTGTGSTMAFNTAWNNAGAINVNGGTLTFGGTGTFAKIGTVNRSGGTVNINGSVDGVGGALQVGAGTMLGGVTLQAGGIIHNGTLLDSGAGLIAAYGTFDNVTYRGTLDMSAPGAAFTSINGITFSNLANTGPAGINFTGNGGSIWFGGTETADNVNVNIGSAGGDTFYGWDSPSAQSTLTLGPNFRVTQTGVTAALRTGATATDRVINQGSILAGGASSTFTISGAGTLVNQGLLSVANGGSLNLASINFSNLNGTVLTGGTYAVGANSTMQLASNATIVTDAADITLSGANSVIQSFKTATFSQVAMDTTLTTIAPTGALRVLGGRGFTAGATLTDNGMLQLGGGTLTVAAAVNGLLIGATGTLLGFGNVTFGAGKAALFINNTGLIEANGGKLVIGQPVSGAGDYAVDAGATLELGGSATAGAMTTMNGGGATLLLDHPATYAGSIANFGTGDLLDLAGVVATGATISGSTLTVALTGGATRVYTVTGNTSTGALRVATDGHGGSLVTGYQLAVPSAHTPEPVTFANAHVGDALSQTLTLTNNASTGGASENLNASLGAASGAMQVSGSIAGLAPGQTDASSLTVTLDTSADGVRNGAATLTLASDGTSVPGDGYGPVSLGTQNVTASGTVYALAAPVLAGASVNIGASRVGGSAIIGTLAIGNGVVADPYQESLVYSTEAPPLGMNIVSATTDTVASGASSGPVFSVNSSVAGVYSGPVVIDFTSTGAGTSGLADTVLASQTVTVTGKVYTPAVANLINSALDFGSVHSGSSSAGTIYLQNNAYGALTDVLAGGFGAIAAPFSSNATLGAGLASGASGGLALSFAPVTGGAYGGSAPLNLVSHDADQADLPLAAGPVTLSGTAWDFAAPSLNATVLNFGATRVGVAPVPQSIKISDGASASAFQESLAYATTATPFGTYNFNGPLSGTVHSGGTASISVSLNTTYSGDETGLKAVIQETSTGSGTSGLADTALGGQTITLNGKVYAPAVPAVFGGTYTFNAHAGQASSLNVLVGNATGGALTDILTGGFGAVSSPWQGSGTLNAVAGTFGQLSLSMNTAADGVFAGTAAFALNSHDADQSDLSLSLPALSLSGTVYAYAKPILSSNTLNFGAVRLGAAPAGQGLTIADGVAPDAYQEQLYYIVEQTPLGYNNGIGQVGTIASGASAALGILPNTQTAGDFTNAKITVDAWSVGAAGSGFGYTPLASQTITANGKVYAPAQSGIAVSGIGFGVLHVGQVVSQNIVVPNIGKGALVDLLTGGWGAFSSIFSGSGNLGTGIAAGAAGQLTVNVNTSTSGFFSGSGALNFASHDSDLTDLNLNLNALSFNATVDNYAAGAFQKLAGNGTLTGSGTNYTLALGSVVIGNAGLSAQIGALNGATGTADLLSGAVTASGDAAFNVTGLKSFSNISAGQFAEAPVITFSTSTIGAFQEKIVLSGNGSNFSGYNAAVQSVTLTVTGTVTPLPAVWNLTFTPTVINASSADDTFNASNGVLWSGDTIDGGGGTNKLVLTTPGQFDMTQPTQLTNIQIVQATEGQRGYVPPSGPAIPNTAQTLMLRAGLDLTVNVASIPALNPNNPNPATITIIGAANNDIINLGSGSDIVTLGGTGETVNGGSGNNTYNVTGATIGATINGGTGTNTLAVTGGGSMAMGNNVAQISLVTLGLTSGAPAYVFTANAIPNLTIRDNTAGSNTIVAGAASDTINLNGAHDQVQATAANATAIIKNPGTGCSLEITTGGTITLNPLTTVNKIVLDQASKLTLNKTIGVVAVGSSGADTITAAGQGQTLSGGAGIDTLIASVFHGDLFKDLTANFNGDTIKGFGTANGLLDKIDFTDLKFATKSGKFLNGKLSVTDGTHSASITMPGALTLANFTTTADGTGGTLLTFHV